MEPLLQTCKHYQLETCWMLPAFTPCHPHAPQKGKKTRRALANRPGQHRALTAWTGQRQLETPALRKRGVLEPLLKPSQVVKQKVLPGIRCRRRRRQHHLEGRGSRVLKGRCLMFLRAPACVTADVFVCVCACVNA